MHCCSQNYVTVVRVVHYNNGVTCTSNINKQKSIKNNNNNNNNNNQQQQQQ